VKDVGKKPGAHGARGGPGARRLTCRRRKKTGTIPVTDGSRESLRFFFCVIWIGVDDNRDIGLQAGVVGAPIWGRTSWTARPRPSRNTGLKRILRCRWSAILLIRSREPCRLATANCPTPGRRSMWAGSAPDPCYWRGPRGPKKPIRPTTGSNPFSRVWKASPKRPKRMQRQAPHQPYDSPIGRPMAKRARSGRILRSIREKGKRILCRDFWYLWR